MPVNQAGSINLSALNVPDVYVNILQPPLVINGLATNILGIVGTATWGPVNSPFVAGDLRAAVAGFGNPQNRKYDLVSGAWFAAAQGANNFRLIRVTDGTDAAATRVVQTNCITFNAKYTGTLGNSIQLTVAAGSQASTTKLTVALPGYIPEVFDNIVGSGNALWIAMAAAVNNGNSPQRGPSQLITATAGVGATAPTLTAYTMAGGLDGATTITGATLIGSDTTPRTGMYALRNTGSSVAFLADCDDSTTWATQVTFGSAEGIYMIMTGPAGDTISAAVAAKASAGIDNYDAKLLFGDWIYFNDTINITLRLVSPQGFVAGKLSNLSPEQSSLNKPLNSIVGTQKSYSNQVYSSAELSLLGVAGIDVITNPIPAGNSFGARFGHNSSSNFAIHGDNYTRMTNFLAYTFNSALGLFVGRLQSQRADDKFRRELKNTIDNFLQTLVLLFMVDDFQVQCDLTNNTPSRIAAGYCQVDIKVRYLAVVEYLIVNLEGGQTVSIQRVSTTPA